VPPGWDDWRGSIDGGLPSTHPLAGDTYHYYDTTLSRGDRGLVSYAGKYQTRVYGNLTESVVRSRAAEDRPYFLWVSFAAPHNGRPGEGDDPGRVRRSDQQLSIINTPARPRSVRGMFDDRIRRAPGVRWSDPDFSDKPAYLSVLPTLNRKERLALRELARQRAEALHLVDRQVKRTVDTLADVGTLDETVFVFVSDNGYFLGEQRVRSGKRYPHEPSLRVPFLVRGPGLPAGAHRQDPITSIDIAATLAELAGVTPGHAVDGVSLAGVARSGDRGWRRALLTTNGPMYHTARPTDEAGGTLEEGESPDLRYQIGIRTRQYLYVDVATGERELYDVSADPQQYHNLAGRPEHVVVEGQLADILARMRTCRAAECSTPLPGSLQ
jgi:arylsulfatase A-like enzyme